MGIKVRDTSRLRFARLVTLDGIEHWEHPEYPEIGAAPDDIIYTVDLNDRIDLIAERFYSSPDLWWIIALANELRLLPNDLNGREKLRIPSGRRVFTEILRKPSRGREGR